MNSPCVSFLLLRPAQDRFRNIPTRVFWGAEAVVCVFDLSDRQSWAALPHWIAMADKLAVPRDNNPQVRLLVGNKADLVNPKVSRAGACACVCSVHCVDIPSRSSEFVLSVRLLIGS